MVKIGEFYILQSETGKIWIRREDDEGGQFSEKELAHVIELFYSKNF